MSFEVLQIAASLLTAAIIAATAIAALVQLRHIRSSNELTAFNEALELWYSPPIQAGFQFIQSDLKQKMQDSRFRHELETEGIVNHATHPDLNVCDFFDNIGVMVTLGMMREDVILHPAAQLIETLWQTMSPTIAIMRRKRGRQLYISLEYLAVRAILWQRRYPEGFRASGWARLPNPDVWLPHDG